MDDTQAGLRTQDVNEALKLTSAFGPKEVHFEKTLLMGKAASLAMHLKGLPYLDDITQLKYAAATLQIRSTELEGVLRELEHIDFVGVVKSGDEIKRIDIRVPEFKSGYTDIGRRWKELNPTEIEQAGLETIGNLQYAPKDLEKVQEDLGLDETAFHIMLDVLGSGYVLRQQTIEGNRWLYTPLAFDEDPLKYLEWSTTFPEDVKRIIDKLRQDQGLVVSSELPLTDPNLLAGIETGVFLPVQVNGPTGRQSFIFAPHGSLKREERAIVDKARAIVACVRYGQGFAAGRRIKFPVKLLEYLRENKTFKYGNDEIPQQYSLLAEKVIASPYTDASGKPNLRFIDTDENILALETAISMISDGETQIAKTDLSVKKIMATSGYIDPHAARPIILSSTEPSRQTSAEILRQQAKIASLARGVSDL